MRKRPGPTLSGDGGRGGTKRMGVCDKCRETEAIHEYRVGSLMWDFLGINNRHRPGRLCHDCKEWAVDRINKGVW